jgi:hypothetical protein
MFDDIGHISSSKENDNVYDGLICCSDLAEVGACLWG